MIHVEGNNVKCGNAAGNELVDDASKAIIAVFETLKQTLPPNITEEELMDYILKEIGRNIAHYKAQIIDCHVVRKSTSDALDKYFGDLFGK